MFCLASRSDGWCTRGTTPTLQIEFQRLDLIFALTLFFATELWLFYVALEPYVRRFWPQVMIGWTRRSRAGVRDPLVGRDVLVGVAAGTIGARC